MTQSHLDRICNHFGVSITDITKVTEWYAVFHVVVKVIGSRFVSKAVVYEVGNKSLFDEYNVISPEKWCLYNLKFLTRLQLRSLCCLLGVASNGAKHTLITRIKNTIKVMVVLTPYVEEIYQFIQHYKPCDPDDLTMPLTLQAINNRFMRKHKQQELKTLCIQAGLSLNNTQETKRQLSHKLFTWFDNCLERKQTEYKLAIALRNKATV